MTQTYPSGKVVRFGYDASGDLSKVSRQTAAGEFVYAGSFSYTPHGQVERMRLGNAKWETTQFNSNRRITQIGLGYSAEDTGLWKVNYDYGEWEGATLNTQKDNGNLARQTTMVPTIGAASGFTAVQTYSYDTLDRLKSAAETIGGSQTWKQTFLFDRFGNKTFDTANTTILSSSSAVAKITNPEILATNNQFKQDQDGDSQPDYLFDASGNLTRNARAEDFTYDAENRQITATGSGLSTSHSYDGNGKRVKSHNSITNQTTIFVYDADGDVSAEYTINVPPPTVPTISYLTEDALGSVRVTTNSFGDIKARRDFLPFGEELFAGLAGRTASQKYSSNTDDTRKKFATYERDTDTGLDWAQSRYYSPVHGRFTSPDEFKGGPDELFDFEEDASDNPTFYADLTNPQSLNKYQYGHNNPYKFNDPTGHCPPLVVAAIAAACFILTNPTPIGPRQPQSAAEVAGDLLGVLPVPGAKFVGGVAGKLIFGAVAKLPTRKAVTKVVTVSAKRFPESAKHIKDAQKARKPKVLTVDRKRAAANRKEALKDKKKETGKDRDEYPPAVTREGGKDASVRNISPGDNRGAGASIGRQIKDVKDGEKIRIKVVEN